LDRDDIAEILLKVALKTTNQLNQPASFYGRTTLIQKSMLVSSYWLTLDCIILKWSARKITEAWRVIAVCVKRYMRMSKIVCILAGGPLDF